MNDLRLGALKLTARRGPPRFQGYVTIGSAGIKPAEPLRLTFLRLPNAQSLQGRAVDPAGYRQFID